MAAAAEERVVVAAEETVTSVRSTSSSTSNGGASVTTTTTTSTSRFGRLFGLGGGGTEAAVEEEETTTTTVTTTAIAEAPLQQHEDGVGSPASGGGRPPSLRGAGSGSGTGSGSKRRTLSFLGPTASGTGAVGLPSEAHKEVFAALRAKVEKEAAEDNVAPFNSEDYLNRVLVARNLDVDAAFKMWQGIVAWRKEYKPDVLSDEEAAPYLSQNVISRCGSDKYGHPCIYACSKNHFIDAEHHERNLRTIVHMLDSARREATEKGNGFIAVIIDQDQCGRKNMDTHLFIGRPGLVHILQDFYPETLAAAYIMHTSWLFRAVWAIISPFLDEKTRSKVKVLAKTEDILEHFDVEVLPPSIQEKLGHVAAK